MRDKVTRNQKRNFTIDELKSSLNFATQLDKSLKRKDIESYYSQFYEIDKVFKNLKVEIKKGVGEKSLEDLFWFETMTYYKSKLNLNKGNVVYFPKEFNYLENSIILTSNPTFLSKIFSRDTYKYNVFYSLKGMERQSISAIYYLLRNNHYRSFWLKYCEFLFIKIFPWCSFHSILYRHSSFNYI